MKFSSVLYLAASVTASPLLFQRDVTVSASDFANFKLYAQYAAASYCNSDVPLGTTVACVNSTCPAVTARGAKVLATFAGLTTDQRGFVTVDTVASQIIVSFRGSHSLRNWIANIAFAQTSCDLVSGCAVHTGFANAWSEVRTIVEGAVKAAQAANPGFKVVMTGHSLGGAVATIGGSYLRKAGYAVDIYTYGSPRVGNGAFADFVSGQAGGEFRVTHLNDAVPRLPPLIFGYRHTSPEYWLSDGTATTTDYALEDVKVCTGNANTQCNGKALLFDAEAHSYYLGRIAGCQEDGFEIKRALAEAETDAQVSERLTQWAELDRQFAAAAGDTSIASSAISVQ